MLHICHVGVFHICKILCSRSNFNKLSRPLHTKKKKKSSLTVVFSRIVSSSNQHRDVFSATLLCSWIVKYRMTETVLLLFMLCCRWMRFSEVVKGVIAVNCFKLWEVAEQCHAGIGMCFPLVLCPLCT